jgi:hypothetical protein
VYHPPAVPRRSSTCDSSQAGDEAAAAAEEQQQHQKQHLQQQQDDSSQQLGAEPVQQHGDEPQQQQQQQQQEWQQQESVQPPLVEFGPYFSQQPVRQYVGHTEDILDISWSAGAIDRSIAYGSAGVDVCAWVGSLQSNVVLSGQGSSSNMRCVCHSHSGLLWAPSSTARPAVALRAALSVITGSSAAHLT